MTIAEKNRDERMRWWREARFGMFVHWGLYSIPAGRWGERKWTEGGVEWIQQLAGIPADIYEKELLPQFNPKEHFAAEWADTAAAAGCRYLVFTTKHHEGFALHDSRLTEFDAKDVCGRDLVEEIVDAARLRGLKVGMYHSLIDWHHPDAYAGFELPSIEGTANEGRDNSRYVDYLHGQVMELMTGYGPVDVLWWDYSSKECNGESWRAKELISMIRQKQPDIVMNNRLYRSAEAGWPEETDWSKGFTMSPEYGDFCTPEQQIPPMGIKGVDWEACMTLNTSWGYSQYDHAWKPVETLIQNLVDVVSKGGNYLLNIGPMADGSVPEETAERMRGIGRWMDVNGSAIYGTTSSPYDKPSWGRFTAKEHTVYAHVFEWPDDEKLLIKDSSLDPVSVYLLSDPDRVPLSVVMTDDGLIIHLPADAPDSTVSVIVLELKK